MNARRIWALLSPPSARSLSFFLLPNPNPHEIDTTTDMNTDMTHLPSCPNCNSTKVTARNYARKTGSVVGAAAGAAGSAAAALGGAEAGAALGMVAGPAGSFLGGLAGALMGALFGGAAGCAAGAAVGEVIDTTVLDNHECQDCGHTFGRPPGR